jgi:hypothetical protein
VAQVPYEDRHEKADGRRVDWLADHREYPIDTTYYTMGLVNLPAFVLGLPLTTLAGLIAFRGV